LLAGLVLSACAAAPSGSSAGAPPTTSLPSTADDPSAIVSGSVSPPLPSCAGADLPTRTAGVLTVATGTDATAPWSGGSGAAPGAGLETDLGYAVAQTLGYPADKVTWTQVERSAARAGTATDFDLALDRFTGSDQEAADYSTGYFAITESLVRRADAPTITDAGQVGGLRLGVVGATEATDPDVVPSGSPQLGLADALTDLRSGTVDGVVVDTPTALAVAGGSTDLVVAQLPTDPMIQPDQFHALLPSDSTLTGCVSTAIDRLRVEGRLDELARRWVDPLAPPLT